MSDTKPKPAAGAAAKNQPLAETDTPADSLAAEALMQHVQALSKDIGPRPAGSPEEERAREYIRGKLAEAGITELEQIPFPTHNTGGYNLIPPVVLALLGVVAGRINRIGSLLGGLAGLYGMAALWWFLGMRKSILPIPVGQRQSATIIARIPPTGEVRRRLVLIGHTDSSKHRLFYHPLVRKMLLPTATSLQVVMLVNGLVHLLRAVGPRHALKGLYRASVGALLVDLGLLINEERGGFVEGANDNATAVACLLGLGAHLQQHPLQQTEVWLAFTGAEEVGCLGIHKLLDTHGQDLHDAWFLDFEMVGAGDVAYVTRHSAAGLLNGYKPDPHSAALADKVARQHPEYRVTGRDMTIFEEVGALRKRDYRGLCLVGVGQDGWLVNWHQYSDTAENIDTETLERAARFAWEMMQSLDE
jgi:hypothetical protein